MKKFLIQNCNSKFFRNISNVSIDDYQIINSNINNNLYKLYYTENFGYALFKAELLTAEIIQFIEDFGKSNVKCFVHHNNISDTVLSQMSRFAATHLSNREGPGCITVPKNLVNTTMFTNPNIQRSHGLVCFCEYPVLPEFLNDYLYPKTKLPIKLFNNAKIPHYQNLGLISEKNRAKILQTHTHYLALDSEDAYILEAQLCGSIVLQVAELDKYDQIKYNPPGPHIDYSNFVKDNLL